MLKETAGLFSKIVRGLLGAGGPSGFVAPARAHGGPLTVGKASILGRRSESRSKYSPHQGRRETARRLARAG